MKSLIAFILFGTVLLTACGGELPSMTDVPDTSADTDDSVNDTLPDDTLTPETTESGRTVRHDVGFHGHA